MRQAHGADGTDRQGLAIQRNDDLVGLYTWQCKRESKLTRDLLHVHRRLPDGHVGTRPDIADKLALQALRALQELTGLCPHPSELSVGTHSRSGVCRYELSQGTYL